MNIEEVRAYFDGSWTQAMRGLKLGVNTYQHWVKIGYIPMPAQIKIQKSTKGKLIADINKKGDKS
jgi:hypothetical protein